jgi:hypothetical protein
MCARRLWPLVLVASLGIVPVGPQEHVHEATDDAGHRMLIVHRHAQLHGLELKVEHGTVDHPDPTALFPDANYTAPGAYVLATPHVAAIVAVIPPDEPVIDRRTRTSDQLIHAPPRAPSSLRGPPFSPLL